MGSDDTDVLSRPAHFVTVRPFFIDRTEVTNEQYRRFVEATGYDPPKTWKDGAFPVGEEQMPVTGVTWYDAASFAAWAGKRLPTESEWEFAARGAEGRKYPWGNEWDASVANVDGRTKGLTRVGENGVSPLGIHDMAGNAWEWTANDARSYPGGKEFPWSRLKLKIIRGGNWKSNSESAAATFRGYYGASGEKDYSTTSFRCVKDLSN
jgi:formylglycine-generating enzyme required for sulfatase activity